MDRNFRANCLMLAMSVVAVVAWVAIAEGGLLSSFYISDSVNYMRLAENIKAGNWMNQHGLAGRDGWFAVWPVGYPALLAAFSSVSRLEPYWASKVFSVICCVSLLALFWKCARRQFPILALMLVNLAYLKISRGSLSEQPFIVLMACLGFAVNRIIQSDGARIGRDSVGRIVLLALTFVGLFILRYVGAVAPVWAGVAVAVAAFANRGNPKSAMTWSTTSWVWAKSAAFEAYPFTLWPKASSSLIVCSAASLMTRSVKATSAPSAAYLRAMAFPIPLAAPVMRATLPFKSPIF